MSCTCRFIEQDAAGNHYCDDHGRVDQWGQSIPTREETA